MKKIINVVLATALSASMVFAIDFDSSVNTNNELLVNKSTVTGTPLDAILVAVVVIHLLYGGK